VRCEIANGSINKVTSPSTFTSTKSNSCCFLLSLNNSETVVNNLPFVEPYVRFLASRFRRLVVDCRVRIEYSAGLRLSIRVAFKRYGHQVTLTIRQDVQFHLGAVESSNSFLQPSKRRLNGIIVWVTGIFANKESRILIASCLPLT
jgi:hypothetical protein